MTDQVIVTNLSALTRDGVGSDGPRIGRADRVFRRARAAARHGRQAVVLRTRDGDDLLRPQGGLAYDDPDFDRLIGTGLRGGGTLVGHTSLMTDSTEVPEEP